MQTVTLTLLLLVACAAAYTLGRQRAFALAGGRCSIRSLHSLPSYYGYFTALSCGIPAFLLVGLWLVFAPRIIDSLVIAGMPPATQALPENELRLVLNDIQNLAHGNVTAPDASGDLQQAAERIRRGACD